MHTYIRFDIIRFNNAGLYAGVYTYSKKHTELNTWVGSVVGAVPPLMGWAAATGSIPAAVYFVLHDMYVCMYKILCPRY